MSTVTIACKLPNGIIIERGEKRVRINGWNNNTIQGLSHGITHEVPVDLWEWWKNEFKDSTLVKDGYIFAEESAKRAEDKAKDRKEQKSGHEQLPKIKKTDAAGALGEAER